ncbi:MAG: DUF2335 domain-containing protein [Spirochaetaceae bacterium]|jgi:uncharacterized membrane protein|nr:DUF2335 domain-containing protein [Spirochaetaceae bacterium]
MPENNDLRVQPNTLLSRQEFFSGPLPPPAELKGYKEIDPGYPERLLKMAESHADSVDRLRHEEAFLKHREAMSLGRGQWLSFILGMAGFGLAAIFGFKGMGTQATASIIAGVAPIIVAALGNLRK